MRDAIGTGTTSVASTPDAETMETIHMTTATIDKLKMLREKRQVLDEEITGIELRLLSAVIEGMPEEQQAAITEARVPSQGRGRRRKNAREGALD
jgi:hypothetical protein